MKILVLSGHLPSSQARQAGQKTSFHMCRCLAESHELDLLSFASEDETQSWRATDMTIFRRWEVIPVSHWTRLIGVLNAPRLPLSVAARFSRRFQRELRKFLEGSSYEMALLDHAAMWQYAKSLDFVPLVVGSAHDVLSQLWGRRANNAKHPVWRWLVTKEHARVENWERTALRKLDLVSPHSEKDSRLLRKLEPSIRQFPIQPWHTPSNGANGVGSKEPYSVVFWGAMNRAENIDAVRFAVKEILPKIRSRVPECRFFIAGSHSEALQEFKKSKYSNVVLTGYVPDIHGFLSRMQVALLPLRQGAGIKVKTLECMAAGIGVVTTAVGIEGIGGEPGAHYLLGEGPDELANYVVRLLNSPLECEAIGVNGRELARTKHEFRASMREFNSFLEEMSSRSKTDTRVDDFASEASIPS